MFYLEVGGNRRFCTKSKGYGFSKKDHSHERFKICFVNPFIENIKLDINQTNYAKIRASIDPS